MADIFPVMFAVELMQTSAKAAVFWQLPRSLKWKTLTACCHKSTPKQVVEDNIGDGEAITYDHLYKILFDHVSLMLNPIYYSKAQHHSLAMSASTWPFGDAKLASPVLLTRRHRKGPLGVVAYSHELSWLQDC